ncbi:hypothetical protein [Microbispora rosea]
MTDRAHEVLVAVLRDLHAAGTTIAVITHDPEIAEWCPRQVRVRDGRVVADAGAGAGRRPPGPNPKRTPDPAPDAETAGAAKGAPR